MSAFLPSTAEGFICTMLSNVDPSNPALLENCQICYEEFNASHPAVWIRFTSECQHVFGHQCLVDWLTSDNTNANKNKCPLCRSPLYGKSKWDEDIEAQTRYIRSLSAADVGRDEIRAQSFILQDMLDRYREAGERQVLELRQHRRRERRARRREREQDAHRRAPRAEQDEK
ncbi:uncharacterized protein BDZ99DRAFT_528010 [Mytilinidion resinicola]|uniref:RING-type domain-containing protein n=1 Tax=Mytilinidion resinicola TaxID=574789 RepID=A0A6A6XZV3_9PEZI|nr:uncharacterized protein BDZ99DRAFT_528010 [Mytilinidion resinicola]KAF2801793.1 hypothetical protein BDZ99DRAFT_528010 [Mytilinidion resinicola]